MNRWKGRIKRILALALAFSLIGSGTNNLMSSAASETGAAEAEEVALADREMSEKEIPVSLWDMAVRLDEGQEIVTDGPETSEAASGEAVPEETAPETEDGEQILKDSGLADEEDDQKAPGENGESTESALGEEGLDGEETGEASGSGETDGAASGDSGSGKEEAKEPALGEGGLDGEETGEASGSGETDGAASGDSGSGKEEAKEPASGEADGAAAGENATDGGETQGTEAAEQPSENSEDEVNAEADGSVEAVKALVSALPSQEEVRAQSAEEREESYRQVCDAYAAYAALTEEQKAQIGGADEAFALLFACYEEMEQAEEIVVEQIDLSDWIFQEGGSSAWPDEPMAAWSLEGEPQAQAQADLQGAGNAIMAAARNWDSQIDISGYNVTVNDIGGLFVDLFNYNPEFFYVKLGEGGCSYSYYAGSGLVAQVMLVYNEYTKENVQAYKNALDKAYAEAITSEGMTKVQKARALHDYLAQHMEYDKTLKKYNAYNALVEGTAVCQGYTLAYMALLSKAGIGADYCIGAKDMNHIWNYVELDGSWYHVDVTWDDPLEDKLGYVGYKYFLCSDAQMGSEGTSKNVHHGWDIRQTCGSTTYDNAYWKYAWSTGGNALSAIFCINGGEYYLRRTGGSYETATVSLICRSGETETSVCEVPAVWKTSGGYWPGLHSSLSYYNGILYFNSQDIIYALRPGRDTAMRIHTYSGANALYGSFVCDGRLTMEIADSPNRGTVERQTIALPEVPQIPVGTITNKAQGGYQTSYVYDGTTVPQPTASQFDTTNTGGAMTFTWYKGSVTEENRLTFQPVDAGNYVLQVRVEKANNYDWAVLNLNVTIAKAQATVSVTAQNKTYDGTVSAVVDASLAGIISGDVVSLVKPTGAFADKNAGTGKKVALSGGSLTGEDAANYTMAMPAEVSADIAARAITVTADGKEKTYGDADPALTYTVSAATPLVAGESLTGSLAREQGEDVKDGGYRIMGGSLTTANNPNYTITFQEGKFTVKPAQYGVTLYSPQNVLEGIGVFEKPVFALPNGKPVPGEIHYTYGGTYYTYEGLVDVLKALNLGGKGTVDYTFTPANGNYTGAGTGSFAFEIKDVEFLVGTQTANRDNAVTVKDAPVYGDTWEQIVQIGSITARAGAQTDQDRSHFSLSVSGTPDAGERQFQVLYNGTLNGKQYRDAVVCGGTVNVAKRMITVTAGTYRISKVYDGTTAPGDASGEFALSNVLRQDSDKIRITALPEQYENPNVGGQEKMSLALIMGGEAAGNYKLGNSTVEVPCAITPKPVEATLKITGSYSYTGQNIMPDLTVSYRTDDGSDAVLQASDYIAVVTDNLNAGTAKVSVRPREGSNYTWADALEGTFAIAKVDYPYTKAVELSAKYGNTVAFDLASLLPQGYVLGQVRVVDGDGVLQGTPAVDGSVLGYQVSSDREKIGKTAVITVPVTASTNYEPFELTITLTVSDKLEQTEFGFSQGVLNKVYGDAAFLAAVVNAAEGSTLSFTSSEPNVATVDSNGNIRIHNTGSTVITAWASETGDYLMGTAACTLNVAPKALAWDVSGLEAVDREGTVTDRKKASLYGELKVSGILQADVAAVTFSCPAAALTGTYESALPGERKVSLGWADDTKPAVLQGERAFNYTLPDSLPSLTGTINAVKTDLPTPVESTDQVKLSLSVEDGISQVPSALKDNEKLNTPAKIESAMKLNIQEKAAGIRQESIVVYDVTLMVNINGAGWQVAGKDNFPAGGLTVTLPYPEGTGKDANDFVVCHLFTEDGNGHKAGDAEYPAVTKTDAGIRFRVTGLSPISIGWTKAGELSNAVENKPGAPSSGGQQNAGSQQSGPVPQSPKTGEEDSARWYLLSMAAWGGILACAAFRRGRRNRVK